MNSDSSKVKFSPNKIVENFYKIEKYSNLKIVICYKQVFNLSKLKKNYIIFNYYDFYFYTIKKKDKW